MKPQPTLQSYFPPMPEKQFDSMVKRNDITLEKLEALKASVQRGKVLIEQTRERLGKPKPRLTYSCLVQMRQSALWAAEMWAAEMYRGTIGARNEAVRYYKILVYIEKRMEKFEGEVI